MRYYYLTSFIFLCLTAFSFGQIKITEGDKKLPIASESFKINGHDAFVILPEKVDGETPWVWYAPTLRGLPSKAEVWMFERFLAKGIAIAGIDVDESYGSPDGRKLFSDLYLHLTATKKFSKTPCLLARSRGGLMLYNWATENPAKVSGIAAIYPVCNLESYPGLKKASGAYKMTAEQLKTKLSEHNPIERIKPLAEAGVPIFHIQGDSDRIVPHEKNTKILIEHYKEFGGSAELEFIKGQGHNMWKGFFQSEKLTVFAIKCALGGSVEKK